MVYEFTSLAAFAQAAKKLIEAALRRELRTTELSTLLDKLRTMLPDAHSLRSTLTKTMKEVVTALCAGDSALSPQAATAQTTQGIREIVRMSAKQERLSANKLTQPLPVVPEEDVDDPMRVTFVVLFVCARAF